ncbi:MAG: hypothetical protein ACQESE_02740 [Nanobdellota archaeon]
MARQDNLLKNKMDVIICKHCHKKITSPELAGLTLICPHCKKSVNGQYHHHFIDE